MILVKRLKQILAKVPDDWQVNAYEGEGVGFALRSPDQKKFLWIEARDTDDEDIQEPWANP